VFGHEEAFLALSNGKIDGCLQPCWQLLDLAEYFTRDNHSSLSSLSCSAKKRKKVL